MSARDVDLQSTLDRIGSGTAQSRKEGLADLEYLIRYNKNSHVIASFKDKTWHAIFDKLFSCAAVERSSYLRSSHSQKSKLGSRLAACGKALRTTVEACVGKIRAKTVKAVVDHILQTLPTTERSYCPDLSLDYVKSLRVLLEHQPHVEYFRELWQDVLDFCLEGVAPLRTGDDEVIDEADASLRTSLRTATISLSRRSRAGTPQPLRSHRVSMFRNETSDLVACIFQLVRATNAPIAGNELSIVDALQVFLRFSDSIRGTHNEAFGAINSVLSRTAISSVEATQSMLVNLVVLIKDLWSSKSPTLKDEMLVTLVLTKDHVSALVDDPAQAPFRVDLENLLETLQQDYSKRLERDQLQINELILDCSASSNGKSVLRLPGFALQRGRLSAESLWTTLYLIAHYTAILDKRKLALYHNAPLFGENQAGLTAKRPRLSSLSEDLVRLATSSPTPATRIANLQYLCFLFQVTNITVTHIQEILASLSTIAVDQNPNVARWAILACASCAFQDDATSMGLQEQWITIYRLATRSLTIEKCSRAASYLLYVLQILGVLGYGHIADMAEAIIGSVELQGPTDPVDSSLALLRTLLDVRSSENPSAAASTAERLVQWLFQRWTPSAFQDKEISAKMAYTCRPVDLLQFLWGCQGQSAQVQAPLFNLCGQIAHAWYKMQNEADLTDFLLLQDQKRMPAVSKTLQLPPKSTNAQPPLSILMQILDALEAETGRVLALWNDLAAERPQAILREMFTIVGSLIAINAIFVRQRDERAKRKIESLRQKSEALTSVFTDFLARAECELDKLDAAIDVLADYLPCSKDIHADDEELSADDPFISLSVRLAGAFARRSQAKVAAVASQDDMDIDDGFQSQHSEATAAKETEIAVRDITAVTTNTASFRACVTAHVHLIAATLQASLERPDIASSTWTVPSSFVTYLTDLPPQELFACRPVLCDVMMGDTPLSTDDAEMLFEHIGYFHGVYEYAWHEVALILHLDLLLGTASKWTSADDNEPLSDSAVQAYEWFMTTALPNDVCSSSVKIGIAKLLFELFRIKGPNYQPTTAVSSVRTCLFELPHTGDLTVIHVVVQNFAKIFEHFTLEKHEDVFNDLHKSSLLAETWLEGNALRILLFANLGSRWHTLLRRCIYHIFETAGAIPKTSPYAARCMKNIATHLGLDEPQSLFHLFAGQLLYTWTQPSQGSWSSIPYSIFGYKDLRDALFEVRDEVYSQLLMRNDKDELVDTSSKIGLRQSALAKESFPRAAAYSLAWDAEMKARRSAEKDRSETRLRGLLGDHYTVECKAHYPKMIGILLLRTNFEKKHRPNDDSNSGNGEDIDKDAVEAMLEKRISSDKTANGQYNFAADALKAFKDMKPVTSSALKLPDPQQPMFRPKVFLDVADRIARRVKASLATLLAPAVYVFVLRVLLSDLHDALGSLHSCLIVRKIRLLIALSGPSALTGYPLEITLHSLRPLLTDKQCADDTLAIVQYLYTNGIEYLETRLNFVVGMNLTTLISLRRFVGSSQDSTTQESHHIATVDKANTFRRWLVETWSKKFAAGKGETPAVQSYLRLMAYAFGATSIGNATTNSAESNLLQQILEDRQTKQGFLQGATWNLALKLLCTDFEEPSSFRQDIFGLDSEASKFAAALWASIKDFDIDERYFRWVARVLGRANRRPDFDHSALFHNQSSRSNRDEIDETKETSQKIIISRIADLLPSDNLVHSGLAEETLRSILVQVADAESLAELQEQLSDEVVQGLYLRTEDVVVPITVPADTHLEECLVPEHAVEHYPWLRKVTISLVTSSPNVQLVNSLGRILAGVDNMSESLFAPILHLVLRQDLNEKGVTRQLISQAYRHWLSDTSSASISHIKTLLQSLLYLRKQPYPQETTHAERLKWLDVDFTLAAEAAERCGMHTAALLFAELTSLSQPIKGSRRSTTTLLPAIPEDILLQIYRNIEDPDSFYGVPQPPSLDLVLSRLDHEADGFKSLMFRGAKLDSKMRQFHTLSAEEHGGLIKSLVGLNMNTLTYNLLPGHGGSAKATGGIIDSVVQTAMRLEQWDVRAPETANSDAVTLYQVFQAANNGADIATVRKALDAGLTRTLKNLLTPSTIEKTMVSSMCTLGILTEIDDVISATTPAQLRETWEIMRSQESGLSSAHLHEVSSILSSREILFSTLSSNSSLRNDMHVSLRDVRTLQVDALLSSCRVWKKRQGSQQALDTVTYLSDLVPVCAEIGIDINGAAQNVVADVLWAQGEYSTAVQMLQDISEAPPIKNAPDEVHRASLLAKLGHHVGEARLEPASSIMSSYLSRAIDELRGQTQGAVAGQVFHQFASFCDAQLQNQENVDDLERAEKVRSRRKIEVEALGAEIRAMKSQTERNARKHDLTKAQRWYKLDNIELERLRKIREKFMEQCLENYLLSLAASDEHDNDALRFYAIWLENAESDLANTTVQKHLRNIPSAKLARLMNQLSSRLQSDNTLFQKLLSDLVLRICREHPFHGMHHITAGTHDPGTSDKASKSRHTAAKHIATKLKHDKHVGYLWNCMFHSDRLYHEVARYTDEDVQRQGREFRLDQFGPSQRLQENIGNLQTPPPTLSIPIKTDMDYKSVPRVIGFLRNMRVAGGLSAPKIITSKLSDGTLFKQLFKGGNDDLRQDAIMEQVFAEVSKLLGNHTTTRQRKLRIRTYNVLPLSNRSGVLEFAQNTTALQDALVPLHQIYHPKDLKSSACRQKISDAARDTTDARIKAYKDVCKQFQPAMRYFFFERFLDPDAWFDSRLAYTRSTAAMSILGYVIGLGDRHLHNILLDYVTGEVVHIDLGVCFEAGRVLPIPEVVPFRLTRDLVDGMGYTRTEGVYRRCCEFTLEALRAERESIMTLLNVLRYDPLYSWTVSSTKAKRLQEEDDVPNRAIDEANMMEQQTSRKKDDEMGEAGRALGVVEKKLSGTLSKEAAVSELVAQATDERNLALLFAGWSAWV